MSAAALLHRLRLARLARTAEVRHAHLTCGAHESVSAVFDSWGQCRLLNPGRGGSQTARRLSVQPHGGVPVAALAAEDAEHPEANASPRAQRSATP